MKIFWQLVYNLLFLPIIYIIARISSIFNRKIKEGFVGRRKTIAKLQAFFKDRSLQDLVYWFHSASHGEYEQVRPVLSGLKEIEPECKCIVSFFSPSGYQNVNDSDIDLKIYLPVDFYWNSFRVLKIAKPHKLVFAEYDVWPNLIWSAQKLNVKTTVFSARIPSNSTKLIPIIRSFYRHVYGSINTIYTVSEKDHTGVRKLLRNNSTALVRVLGNPRYDRVKELADKNIVDRSKSIMGRDLRLIAGSVWPEDEIIILETLLELMRTREDFYLYWVPHEPDEKYYSKAKKAFEIVDIPVKLMSKCKNGEMEESRVIIIDSVGKLAELYWRGRIAYVGGGFSTGIHNVMEPAIARLPTIFGPKFHNSYAAEELIEAGGGFSISNDKEFRETLEKLLNDIDYFLKSSSSATGVIHKNIGSATRVVRGIIRD